MLNTWRFSKGIFEILNSSVYPAYRNSSPAYKKSFASEQPAYRFVWLHNWWLICLHYHRYNQTIWLHVHKKESMAIYLLYTILQVIAWFCIIFRVISLISIKSVDKSFLFCECHFSYRHVRRRQSHCSLRQETQERWIFCLYVLYIKVSNEELLPQSMTLFCSLKPFMYINFVASSEIQVLSFPLGVFCGFYRVS